MLGLKLMYVGKRSYWMQKIPPFFQNDCFPVQHQNLMWMLVEHQRDNYWPCGASVWILLFLDGFFGKCTMAIIHEKWLQYFAWNLAWNFMWHFAFPLSCRQYTFNESILLLDVLICKMLKEILKKFLCPSYLPAEFPIIIEQHIIFRYVPGLFVMSQTGPWIIKIFSNCNKNWDV